MKKILKLGLPIFAAAATIQYHSLIPNTQNEGKLYKEERYKCMIGSDSDLLIGFHGIGKRFITKKIAEKEKIPMIDYANDSISDKLAIKLYDFLSIKYMLTLKNLYDDELYEILKKKKSNVHYVSIIDDAEAETRPVYFKNIIIKSKISLDEAKFIMNDMLDSKHVGSINFNNHTDLFRNGVQLNLINVIKQLNEYESINDRLLTKLYWDSISKTRYFDDINKIVAVHESGHTLISKLMHNKQIAYVTVYPNEGHTISYKQYNFNNINDYITYVDILLGGKLTTGTLLGEVETQEDHKTDNEALTTALTAMVEKKILFEKDIEKFLHEREEKVKEFINNNKQIFENFADKLMRHEHLYKEDIDDFAAEVIPKK